MYIFFILKSGLSNHPDEIEVRLMNRFWKLILMTKSTAH
jgi:hypothetical protein